jgi:hypothetical protein
LNRGDVLAAVQHLRPGDDVEATVEVDGRTYVHRGIVRDDVEYPGHLIIPRFTVRGVAGFPPSGLTSIRVIGGES